MIKIITLVIIMFSFFTKGNAQYDQLANNFSFKSVEGATIDLENYKEKVIYKVDIKKTSVANSPNRREQIFCRLYSY